VKGAPSRPGDSPAANDPVFPVILLGGVINCSLHCQTVVRRNSLVWWEGGRNTTLWLVRKRVFLYVPNMNY